VAFPALTLNLTGVWGSGPNDVWAVGAGYRGQGCIITHWNGWTWSPGNSRHEGGLWGVWGSGPNDVWAVGTTILHYN
jgi:hypothetical protein